MLFKLCTNWKSLSQCLHFWPSCTVCIVMVFHFSDLVSHGFAICFGSESCLIRKINDLQAITTDRQGKTFCHKNCKDMFLTCYYQESIPCLFVFSFSCVFLLQVKGIFTSFTDAMWCFQSQFSNLIAPIWFQKMDFFTNIF